MESNNKFDVIVIGAGPAGLTAGIYLSLVHQFDHFQAFEHAVEEASNNPKISFIMESTIMAFYGNENLEGVVIKNLKSGETSDFRTDGTFIFIGYLPNTEFLKGKVEMNKWGEILVKGDMSTNIEGVYAAGDSTAKRFRQVTTAVGDGTVAALAASNYLNELKIKQKQIILI